MSDRKKLLDDKKRLFGPKPLRKIEQELDKSLEGIDADPSVGRFVRADLRLEAFARAFQEASEQLRTYGPLLERIRQEYQGNLIEARKELKFSERQKKSLMQDLSDLKTGLLEHGDLTGDRFAVTDSSRLGTGGGRGGGGGEEKIGALEQLRQRARFAHAHSKLERMEKEKAELEANICIMERKLSDSDLRLKAEEEAKNIMYAEYAELQSAFDRFKDAVKEQEDPVVLRLALDQSRRDLSKAHAVVARYRHEYDCVVPQALFDAVEQKLAQVSGDNSKLATTADRLRRENRELLQALQEATEELQARIIRDDETRLDRTVREGVEKWKRLTEDNKDK